MTVAVMLGGVAVIAIGIWAYEPVCRIQHYLHFAAVHEGFEREARLRSSEEEEGVWSSKASLEENASYHAALKDRYRDLAFQFWKSPDTDLPMPYPWDRDRDRDVIEAALADLIDPENKANALWFQPTSGVPEFLLHTRSGYYGMAQLPQDKPEWANTEPLLQDLERRWSQTPVSLAEMEFQRVRVKLTDLEADYEAADKVGGFFSEYVKRVHPNAVDVLHTALPGYSRDGQRALVVLLGGFSPHGTSWICLLERRESGWVVVARDRQDHE